MKKVDPSRLYHIPVLSKALDVLELLQRGRQSASLEDIHRQTRISKSTIYRILRTLEHRGYVAHLEDGNYRAVSGPSKLRFGFAGQSGQLPFSQAVTESLREAAAASGIDLLILDNCYDAKVALENTARFVQEAVDVVIEFQIDQSVAPIISDHLARASIPLIAVEVPHPHGIFFGVDNFRVGFVAGEYLAQYAKREWRGKAKRVLGLDIQEAGPLVQSRITGAFEAIREVLPETPLQNYVRLDARGLRERSYKLSLEFLQRHSEDRGIIIVAADDTTALGALRAVRELKREKHVAIAGQDCLAEAMSEMQRSRTPLVASVSHEVRTYGPRLIQLGLSLARGQHVAPYHYVSHRLVTAEIVGSGV